MLKVDGLSVSIRHKEIVKNIDFQISDSDICMIVGPNGSGKTTIIKGLMQSLHYEGTVLYRGKDVKNMKPYELAKYIGVLTQHHQVNFPYTVAQIVEMGRYPYQRKMFQGLSSEDYIRIEEAMELTGVKALKDRSVLTLSGGEVQRVFLAKLLAQDPNLLIMDEPTNNLDIQYQIIMFDIIKEWVKKENRAVISIVHDLNLVYRYGTKALLINKGETYAYGAVDQVLGKENLKAVYQVDVSEWMSSILKHWT